MPIWFLPLLGIVGLAPQAGPSFDGVYSLCEDVAGETREVLELKEGHFRYWFSGDLDFGTKTAYPIAGTYEMRGRQLVFNGPKEHLDERTVDTLNDVSILWRQDGLALWEKERRIKPYAVLIRIPGAKDGERISARPALAVLYTKELKDREKREYEERFKDLPAEVRILLRARTEKDDPRMKGYISEIRNARIQPDPKVLAQIVALLAEESAESSIARRILEDLFLSTDLCEEAPPFTKDEKEIKKALEALIDALSHATDRNALELTIMVWLQVAHVREMELSIPDAGVELYIAVSAEGRKRISSTGPPGDSRWRAAVSKLVPECQKWMREHLPKNTK